MVYQPAIETYSGKIEEVIFGQGNNSIRVGSETTLPFHSFEGTLPNSPKLALEVSSRRQSDGAGEAFRDFENVMDEPAAWAKKYVAELGVELISLQLSRTDARGKDVPVEEVAAIAAEVTKSVSAAVIIYGTGEPEGDRKLLSKVAEMCAGNRVLLGPVKKENYKEIAAAALKYGHSLIAQTPLDVNASKQLNIMLTKEGIPADRIVIDPLSSALGYGMEYSYSVMERIRLAALVHNDKMMQMPIIANIGAECWKTKEAKESSTQGILWEGITALCFILAGANIVVLKSPQTYKLMQRLIK
jgi:acetyl-CoA decarbonylase/synthase complex subunit delta